MKRTPEQKEKRRAYEALPHVRERIRELAKLKYEMNPQKYCDRQKFLRLTQPEKIRQYEKTKYAKHKEKILVRAKKYAAENPEVHRKASAKYLSKNKEECYRRIKEWDKAHPEKKRFYTKAYRASKFNQTPAWADLDLIAEAYQEAEYHGLHVDHIVPLRGKTVCGLHVWDNLQLITKSENSAKGNRHWPDMP